MKRITGDLARRKWVMFVAGCTLALAAGATTAYGQQFALKDGDTVVFYGDSITAQRFYTRDVEDFVLTRYPNLHVHFINAGVPGDTVNGGYAGTMAERVQRDVAPFHPAMITLMLGMNDGGWGTGSAEIDANFQKGYRAVVEALRKAAPDAAITLICPTPYDEITHGTEFPGYSKVIDKFADEVPQIAAQLQAAGDKKILVADLNHPMREALERARTQFPELAPLLVPDRIHPSETGHWIMAAALMSAWHADPVVSRVALNAESGAVIETDRTAVTNVAKTASGLKWTERDEALPLPFDYNNAMIPMLLKISGIPQMDQMTLRVESLGPGRFEVVVDGKTIGSFSGEELQHGVNLALLKSAMVNQARDVDWSEERRATFDQTRFVLSTEIKQTPTSGVAEDKLREAQDEVDALMRKELDPKVHQFELRRQ